MRGSGEQLIEYILDDDKDEPVERQTVFVIRPWTGLAGARIVARYSAARRVQGRRGYDEVNVGKWRKADEISWSEVVVEIRNFAFSDKFPQYQKAGENNDGYVKVIKDPNMILAVAEDITLDQFNEVIEVAGSAGRLSGSDKKK